jgi:hypothetical protein
VLFQYKMISRLLRQTSNIKLKVYMRFYKHDKRRNFSSFYI